MPPTPINNRIADLVPEVTAWRHDFHAHPEILYDVERTAGRVAELLRSFGVDEVATGLGRTGVVGIIRGNRPGRTIGLRADMDALPMTEETGLPYASTVPGRMHACGHDGHTAMLLGAAKYLAETRDFAGTVALIFQPAEEGGAGGLAMAKDGLFERWPIEKVYALHNMPGVEEGRVQTTPGAIMASADFFEITITGKGGHAAWPHNCADPIVAAGQMLSTMQAIVARNADPLKAAVISVTQIAGGTANNVIPDSVKMGGTIRTLDKATHAMVTRRVGEVVEGIAAALGVKAEVSIHAITGVVVNDPKEVELCASVAAGLFGADKVETDMTPLMGGDDFSYMSDLKPACYVFMGNGDSAALHTTGYNFNDNIIPLGISYWVRLAQSATV